MSELNATVARVTERIVDYYYEVRERVSGARER